MIGDRPAMNAAVVIDTLEISLGGVAGFLEAADAAH
jgi:hypothetical protein